MGRVDDKEGECLLSEAEEEKDKDRDTSEAEEEKDKDRDTSEVDEEKDTEKEASDLEDSEPDAHKKYKCTQPGCTARFLRPSRLTWHLRKHNDERPYKCDQEGCTRAYTNSSHLKRHLNTTHKPSTKTYECKECGMELGSLFSLKRHNKKIHDPTRLTCTECGAKFRKKHCYNEHLSMHAGVAMYKCDECNQDFTTLRLYKKHHRIHEGLKTYPCTSEGCTEVFDKWSKLSKHLETEHEFDYKCKKCNKEFKHKKQLHVHSVAHTREDVVALCPYQNCPRFYAHARNLDEHILTAHMGRKFICDICQKSFTFKSAITRHIQVIHEGKTPPPSNRKRRRRRKDAGVHKKSMVTKLVGIELPKEMEERLLNRKPQIDLKRPEMESADESDEKEIAGKKSSSSLIDASKQSMMPIASKKPSEEKEEASLCSKRKNEQVVSSQLTSVTTSVNNESETVMIIDLEKSANNYGEVYEEMLLPVINALENETPMIIEELVEKSCDKVTEIPKFASEKESAITTFMSDDLLSETPIILAQYVEEFADRTGQENYVAEILSEANVSVGEKVPMLVEEILSDWA